MTLQTHDPQVISHAVKAGAIFHLCPAIKTFGQITWELCPLETNIKEYTLIFVSRGHNSQVIWPNVLMAIYHFLTENSPNHGFSHILRGSFFFKYFLLFAPEEKQFVQRTSKTILSLKVSFFLEKFVLKLPILSSDKKHERLGLFFVHFIFTGWRNN